MDELHINLISDNENNKQDNGNIITLDDSQDECENRSHITISDSIIEEASALNIIITDSDDGVEAQQSQSNLANSIEEGEVTPESEQADLIFSVQFKSKDDFQRLHKTVQTALNAALALEHLEVKVEYAEGDNPTLCAYKQTTAEVGSGEELFLVDTAPAKKLNAVLVPSYKRSLDVELSAVGAAPPKNVNKCQPSKSSGSCFNCGSTHHSLRECPKKINPARIRRSKKQHSNKSKRYHVDIKQKYAHLRPGHISSKLRAAMNLQRGELPFMFYRMRILGYPPAWLEDAQVSNSGIALFNAEGLKVVESDEEASSSRRTNIKINASKIIGFPGYNVQPGTRYYDDYKHHSVPAMSEQQSKERLIEALGRNAIKSYKRKKLRNLPSALGAHVSSQNSSTIDLSADDMDIEDDGMPHPEVIDFSQPPLPVEELYVNFALPPPPPPPLLPHSSAALNKRSSSPTLEDLQAQQEQLLQQLQDNVAVEEDPASPIETMASSMCTSTPMRPTLETQFKATHVGTPLLKFSQYDRLPSGENFKVGVSDVINFENLSDSTGKYDQMKRVLTNVRSTISKLQDNDD